MSADQVATFSSSREPGQTAPPTYGPGLWTAGWRCLTSAIPILVEGHHFTPLLRALWGSPAALVPQPLLRPLEDLVVAWSIPIELLIMRAFRRRPTELGLQHVMLLRKRGRDG